MPSQFTPGVNNIGVPGPQGPAGPPGEGGGGPHTHPEYVHTHPYAADPHSHSEFTHTHPYASDTHNHDGVYALVHGHPYASDTHNHDSSYSGVAHNHNAAYSGVAHTHDYAATGHNHDAAYAPVHGHPYADASHGIHPSQVTWDDLTDGGETALHSHAGGSHPNLAAHDTLGLATQSELDAVAAAKANTSHSHVDADIPAGIARDAEVTTAVSDHAAAADPHTGYLKENDPAWIDLTDGGASTAHTHAGGGSSPWTLLMATADQSNNTAVLADDAALQVTLLANTQYHIRLRVFYLTNATADLAYRLVFAGTTTRVRRKIVQTTTGDIPAGIAIKTAFDAADVVLSTTGLNPYFEEMIVLQVGATGGILKVQFKQVTANAGPTTRLEGSYLEYATS